jgi:RHS repeat-associated protein
MSRTLSFGGNRQWISGQNFRRHGRRSGDRWPLPCRATARLGSFALILGLGTVILPTGPAQATSTLCAGKAATLVGSDRGDQLNGTPGDDVIAGLGGGDVINGMGGNDTICGGDGNDVISAGDGDDTINGENGNDSITADAGNDNVNGDAGDDVVSGDLGDDYVFGGDGRDSVYGNEGSDVVVGGQGRDADDGGDGTDTCRLDLSIDTQANCENLDSGAGERPGYTQLASALSDRVTVEVNPATGNMLLRSTDLSVIGTGLNYTVGRYWNSVTEAAGAYGSNGLMSSGADVKLTYGAGNVMTYHAPGGFIAVYTPRGNGGFNSPNNYQAADLAPSGNQFTLTFHDTNEQLTFDVAGKVIRDADHNGNAVSYGYNSDGTLAQATDTQGRITKFAYQTGRVQSLAGTANRQVLYGYDSLGRLAEATDATGAVWSFGYGAGNSDLTQIIDPRGNTDTFSYDSNHRLASAIYAANTSGAATTTYTYGAGTTMVTDPLGHATTYKYDINGNVTSVTDPLGNQRQSSYDPTGHVTSQTSPSAAVANFAYQPGGQLASIQMPTETSGSGSSPGAQTTINYADTSHPYLPSQVTDPQGGQTRYAYDTSGNLASISTFNADGTPTSAHSTATKKYQGDDNGTVKCGARPGQLCTSTTPAGNTTTYGYDAKGNVTRLTPPSPLGETTLKVDALSRVTSSTNGNGGTTTFAYDKSDRLKKSTTSSQTVTYTYDRSGNLTVRKDSTGTTRYTYDAAGHLIGKTAPATKSRVYTYDLAGNLASSGDQIAGTTRYGYDAANECTSVTDPTGAVTTISWTKGQRSRVSYPNGVTQSVSYDAAGRPSHTAATKATSSYVDENGYYQTADGADQLLLSALVDNLAHSTTAYSYDSQSRLTRAQTAGGNDYRYVYDADGNRTQTFTNGSASPVDGFNAADQLTTRAGTAFGSYDANGNALSDGTGQTYAYSPSNQTTTITPPGQSALALRYADTDQSERLGIGSTTSIWGAAGVDQDSTAGKNTYFLRNPSGQLISERTPAGTYYYIYDLRGSVVGLTDASGNRVNSYAYDPYGNLTSSPAAAPVANPWRYNGEYFDSGTGLYHLSARYYDPRLGRFTQPDPTGREPNAYQYASSDPINRTDPSGYFSLWRALAGALEGFKDGGKYGWAIGGAIGAGYAFGAACLAAAELGPLGCIGFGVALAPYGAIIGGFYGEKYGPFIYALYRFFKDGSATSVIRK